MNSNFIFGDSYRIFINTSIGCKASCSYCYLKFLNYPNGYILKTKSAYNIIKKLSEVKGLKYGRFGTIISLGCYCDPWDEINKNQSKAIINHFVEFGNPIQLSTKNYVDSNEIVEISNKIRWHGQICLFISCSTLRYWTRLEKGTTAPNLRFKSFNISKTLGIPSILYIKPVIKDITIQDNKEFLKIIEKFSINAVIGSNFSTNASQSSSPIAKNHLYYDSNLDEDKIIKMLSGSCLIFSKSTEVTEKWRNKR